jgi:PAS domain S-box-containing protein
MVQRRFVANAPLAMAMFDRQMNYLAASPRWLRNYRLEGRELVGRSHYEVFPEIPERWKAAHRRSLAGEVLRMDADRFDRGDGSVQWLKWELRPWFKLSGEVGGITIGTEDITEHKRMEAALCESEENFRNVLATVADAVLVFDAETRKLVEFNEAAVRVYGYRKSCGNARCWTSLLSRGHPQPRSVRQSPASFSTSRCAFTGKETERFFPAKFISVSLCGTADG